MVFLARRKKNLLFLLSLCLSVCLSLPPPLVANSCVSIQGKHCGKLRNGIRILCLSQGSEHGCIEWKIQRAFEISLEQWLLLAPEGSGCCRRLGSGSVARARVTQQGPANLSPYQEGAFCLGVSQPYLSSGITVWNYVMS